MEDLVSAPWLRRLIIAGLLAACVLLGFRVMDPFIVPLVWAGILAFVSWPAYRWLRDKCRGHTTVAALLMTGAVTAAVIAPLAWLAVVLRVELVHTWRETQTLLAGGVQLPPAVLKLPWIGEQLRDLRVHKYLQAIGQTVKAVVYGLVLAALVQGVLVGLGYWFAGTGAPVFLAALTTVSGLIPFAAPTIWGCVVAWLLLKGNTVAGVGLLIWGSIVMSWTDHIVRPFLISREAEIHFLVVMFGVLGGLAAFGLVGLVVGPVILAVLLAIWREWLLESAAAAPRA